MNYFVVFNVVRLTVTLLFLLIKSSSLTRLGFNRFSYFDQALKFYDKLGFENSSKWMKTFHRLQSL